MRKVIAIGTLCLLFSSFELNAACYEPTYPALECDSQGFDSCVNYPCKDDGFEALQ